MFRLKTVSAHCDIPCGIYETDTMTHAAATCLRMIEKIEELEGAEGFEARNTFVRSVMIKEKHAERVKREVAILWGDYFKPEHLEKFPNLHATVWKTLKQASKVKQTVSREEAEKLVEMVHELSHVFADSKS